LYPTEANYAEEFVRLLTDRGGLEGEAEVEMPESVQALIAARLDTLTPERKILLQNASVIGKVFWAGALAAAVWMPSVLTERKGGYDLPSAPLVRPRSASVELQQSALRAAPGIASALCGSVLRVLLRM
jgi:hypothetical protein